MTRLWHRPTVTEEFCFEELTRTTVGRITAELRKASGQPVHVSLLARILHSDEESAKLWLREYVVFDGQIQWTAMARGEYWTLYYPSSQQLGSLPDQNPQA